MSGPSVLFDAPGPRTVARHRLYTALVVLLLIAFGVFAYQRLDANDQLDPEIFRKLFSTNVWTELQNGLIRTLKAAVLAIAASLVVGILLAVGQLSDHRVLKLPSTVIVQFFRAVPLVLMIAFGYAVLRRYAPDVDSDATALLALVAALTLYNGSVLAEVFRAGINAVPRGQSEAAYGIGMRKSQVMRIILIPQAVKFMLPAIVSQCVVVLKDSSLGYVVAYGPELVRTGKSIAPFVGSQLMTYALIALIFVAINSLLSALAYWLERRASRSSGGAAVAQVEDAVAVG